MAFKSKDIIRVSEFGESVKDSLTLLEYRLVDSLTGPMMVNQIYKIIIDKYPDDYFKSSLDFYKTIEVLGSKKIIEKVVIEEKDKEKFEDYFKDEDMMEMSTLVSDEVDFINDKEKERRFNRRKDRWFAINKNNFQKDDSELEINVKETKHLNFKHISLVNEEESNEINIPLDNPFYLSDNEKKLIEEEKNNFKNKSEINSNKTTEENVLVSFISSENKNNEVSHFDVESRIKARKERQKIKEEREKYNRKVKKESLSDKKYVKLREERNMFKLYFREIINLVKKIIKK